VIVALAGGVGGAKMAQGLALAGDQGQLTVVVNTADDFDHYELRICPDLDTVLYTLSGLADPVRGWGIAGDSYATLKALERYGEDPWFLLGDQDFATHILRTESLRQGMSLTEATAKLAAALNLRETILPMTDDRVATVIETEAGELAFQDYFVRRRQEDVVQGVRFEGIAAAGMTASVRSAIAEAELIVVCPSNPIVSIGPILELPGMRDVVATSAAPVVAVSPIIAGKALKGPADRMLSSLGLESSALGVARIYTGIVDGIVIDTQDQEVASIIEAETGLAVLIAQTIMGDAADRARLASEVLSFGRSLTKRRVAAS
jgi:LPPG:FO 2-phospho-L-lactate transferase